MYEKTFFAAFGRICPKERWKMSFRATRVETTEKTGITKIAVIWTLPAQSIKDW